MKKRRLPSSTQYTVITIKKPSLHSLSTLLETLAQFHPVSAMDDITKVDSRYENLMELMPFPSDENANTIPYNQDDVFHQYQTPTNEDTEMPPFPPSLPHWADFQQTNENNYVDYFAEKDVLQLQMEIPLLPYVEPEVESGFCLADSSLGACFTKGKRSNVPHSKVAAGLSSLRTRDLLSRKRVSDTDRARKLMNAEKMESLIKLLPHPTKAGKAKNLDQVIDYIKYLQVQIKDLSQSRLGKEPNSDPFIFLEGYGHYFVHEMMMSNESLEETMGKLIETRPFGAMQLLNSRGLHIKPMHLAQCLNQSNFM